ncbi:sugar-specific transcriptional regulator TrmB/DNA-binding CsgD family transcriptional regulator [Agromyces cerinus]|uniref:Sugar-specific transcriptional regulator TrmB/DNA-binding CsgD family transcriptional regulator n=1 Tax=Agromyces hippuratus TaxID=286438 RepID=A0A852WV84_9MICO|nr:MULTISPECIES: helix-turn-helix transcriptional regulator [Agromyces]MBM7832184.1 sugar-specific transcriptional regulator TrmB/DNA-binding CsgD family transcriptional regulator [Agromyces cerinus]NYG21956.1 sugar-specific transcriptional regulator TrmB/DNA-binding CsgD family transcriptional regulator [Agromyces hippuratus]
MLSAIGLDEGEESVYRLLLALGAADLGHLNRRLGMGEDETGRRLRALELRGLATQSSVESGGRWVAAPPGVALRPLLIQQRLELEEAELTAVALAEEYLAEASESDARDLVEVVVGAAAVSQRFLQLHLGATQEVMSFVTEHSVAVSGPDNQAEGVAVARGVSYRIVVERAVLTSPAEFAEVSAALGSDVNVRVVDRVPTKLMIADRSLAMVPLNGNHSEPAALVIHASGLVDSLAGLFESVWRDATPLVLGGPGSDEAVEGESGLDVLDLQVLSLLLGGFTDASIAKHLDMGQRTVQRRVRGLMQLAGVSSRLQLGWHASERGWIVRG